MHKSKQLSLLLCLALIFMSQTLWGQFVVNVDGTDGSGNTITLTLAVDPAGTASYDSLSPTLREYEIPVAAKGLDFRAASNFPQDVIGLGSYTSIHHMAYAAQTDKWKLQFNVDSGRTSFLVQWPAGLGSVGGGYWRLIPDPSDAITFPDVDMTTSTSTSIPVSDIDPHTFFIVTGDAQMYRSFSYLDLLGALDSKGKFGKAESRKPYNSEGTFTWTNNLVPDTTVTDLHIEWSQLIFDGPLSISPANTHSFSDAPKNKKLDITFTGGLPPGGVVTIYAIGDKGKPLQVKKWWWTINNVLYPPKIKGGVLNPSSGGLLRYRMPNINNVGEEAYSQLVFQSNGVTIGDPVNQSGVDAKSKPFWKAVIHPKWKDVLKTLKDKNGPHTGAADCLRNFISTKPILKTQKALPPAKHNNKLLGEAVMLKVNIGAGLAGKIEQGGTVFGDLMYIKQPGDPAGMPAETTIVRIGQEVDQMMRCLPSSWDGGPANYDAWYAMLNRINGSFSGPFDTISFIAPVPPPFPKQSGTVVKGTKPIVEVPFLHRTTFAVNTPTMNAPNIEALEYRNNPQEYRLLQNYPNPFNPVTTIEYALPEDGLVTMKVYNLLGQEVATLLENELVTSGTNEVQFDATNLTSGVYFYRISAQVTDEDGQITGQLFTKTMKMMLVK